MFEKNNVSLTQKFNAIYDDGRSWTTVQVKAM